MSISSQVIPEFNLILVLLLLSLDDDDDTVSFNGFNSILMYIRMYMMYALCRRWARTSCFFSL